MLFLIVYCGNNNATVGSDFRIVRLALTLHSGCDSRALVGGLLVVAVE
jgi:hypothetical protein